MGFLLLWDRMCKKLVRNYRRRLFKQRTSCDHNDFLLVGNVHVINPNIQLGHHVTIYPDVMFFGDGPIIIGDHVDIGNGTLIYASKNGGGVTIGKNTTIAAQSYIIDSDHGMQAGTLIREQTVKTAPVVIGEDCWLAANVTVLRGSHISNGTVVGAKSLVRGELPENSICVGIPAKPIKYREF